MRSAVNISEVLPAHLFWDVNISSLDVVADKDFIIPRALFATTEDTFDVDISLLEQFYNHNEILVQLKKTKERISNLILMPAISESLLETIIELQALSSLKNAYLGGGTNLAIRFNHRESVDIDLFFSGIIGKSGYNEIEKELREHFGDRLSSYHYPCNKDDQLIFSRCWIRTGFFNIKVEILQNTNFLDDGEEINGARLATTRDIGLLKLMTAANRGAFKDIYDLDYLSEQISLKKLLDDLKHKQETFNKPQHKTIFDEDGEISPVEDPLSLLRFEKASSERKDRPSHSDHRIIPVEGSKNLMSAKSSYRRKIRRLCTELGIEFPGIESVN